MGSRGSRSSSSIPSTRMSAARAGVSLRGGLVDRRVDHVPEEGAIVPALLRILNHEDDEHVLLRVDPEGRAGRPTPVELAGGAPKRSLARGRAHGKSQPKAEAGTRKIARSRLD